MNLDDVVREGYAKLARETFAYIPSWRPPEQRPEVIAQREREMKEREELKERATPFFEEFAALCEKYRVKISASGDERGCVLYLKDADTWRYIADVEDGEFPGDWRVA